MDSLDLFVLGWLTVLLLLLGVTAWWRWFTHEPKWFLAVGAAVLLVLFGAISMMVAELPLWTGWAMVAVALLATVVSLVSMSRKDARR